MTDELKTIKFQLMLSQSEADAIDDWGFRNRIRTRAEAIRRLCQMALVLDEKLSPVTEALNEYGKATSEMIAMLPHLIEDGSNRAEAIRTMTQRMRDTNTTWKKLGYTVRELTGRAYGFKNGETAFVDAATADDEHRMLFSQVLSGLNKLSELQKERDSMEDAGDAATYDVRKAEMLRNGEPGLDTSKKTDGRESK